MGKINDANIEDMAKTIKYDTLTLGVYSFFKKIFRKMRKDSTGEDPKTGRPALHEPAG